MNLMTVNWSAKYLERLPGLKYGRLANGVNLRWKLSRRSGLNQKSRKSKGTEAGKNSLNTYETLKLITRKLLWVKFPQYRLKTSTCSWSGEHELGRKLPRSLQLRPAKRSMQSSDLSIFCCYHPQLSTTTFMNIRIQSK